MARMNLTTFKDNSTTKRIMYGHNQFSHEKYYSIIQTKKSFWVIKFAAKSG